MLSISSQSLRRIEATCVIGSNLQNCYLCSMVDAVVDLRNFKKKISRDSVRRRLSCLIIITPDLYDVCIFGNFHPAQRELYQK